MQQVVKKCLKLLKIINKVCYNTPYIEGVLFMNNIIEFKDLDEYRFFLSSQIKRRIGHGSEGIAYLTHDDRVIKELINCKWASMYDIDEIITSKRYNLESYIFPEELYVIDNMLVGYLSRYVKHDIFNNIDGAKYRNYDNLLKAYNKLLDDTDVLTRDNITINEVVCNLLFDENSLYLIDTCGYKKKDEEDLANIDKIEYGLKFTLYTIFGINFFALKSIEECQEAIKKRQLKL